MDDEQQSVWNYLNENALGYGNRRSSSEIREACQLNSGGPTNEHVRDLIRDMILTQGSCIGSMMYRDGYWIIQNEDELNRVINSLRARANGVLRRANALTENWQRRNG